MKIKTILNQLKGLDERIKIYNQNLVDDIENYNTLRENLSKGNKEFDVNKIFFIWENKINELRGKIISLFMLRENIEKALDEVCNIDNEFYVLLALRYKYDYDWSAIAAKLNEGKNGVQYTEQYVRGKMHGYALKSFEKFLKLGTKVNKSQQKSTK